MATLLRRNLAREHDDRPWDLGPPLQTNLIKFACKLLYTEIWTFAAAWGWELRQDELSNTNLLLAESGIDGIGMSGIRVALFIT